MINCMVKQYNQAELLTFFKEFLVAGKLNSITTKNYICDIKIFFIWLCNSQKDYIQQDLESKGIHFYLSFKILNTAFKEFKRYLVINYPVKKTLNRRLSTLRKFTLFLTYVECITEEERLILFDLLLPIHNIEEFQNKLLFEEYKNENNINKLILFS